MSVYVISGKDTYRAEAYLRHVLSLKNIDRSHTAVFDGLERKFRLENALMECGSFSLFDDGEAKAVIIRNPSFLMSSGKSSGKETKKKGKGSDEKDAVLQMLENYLKEAEGNSDLIFHIAGGDADSRRKEYKLLVKYKATVQKFDRMKDREFSAYADQVLSRNGIRPDSNARSLLLERTGTDTALLHQAVEKILLYGKKNPDEDDIRGLVPLNAEVNIWKMSDSFISGDLGGVIRIRDEMLRNGYDHNSMFAMLASRLRNFYYMKQLYDSGLTYDQISVRIQANSWAVQKNLERMYRLSAMDLLRFLNELAILDQDVKAGKADMREGFEAFLLKNCRR